MEKGIIYWSSDEDSRWDLKIVRGNGKNETVEVIPAKNANEIKENFRMLKKLGYTEFYSDNYNTVTLYKIDFYITD